MQLSFEPSILRGENEIPITAGASVVPPMRNGRIVTQNGVQRDVSLILVAEIFRPRIDLFLPSRVPRHFTSERIRLLLPAVRTLVHLVFECRGLLSHPFALRSSRIATKTEPS